MTEGRGRRVFTIESAKRRRIPLPAYAGTGYEMRGQAAGTYPSITLPLSQKLRRTGKGGQKTVLVN
ncbi:MAG: hypothetical protein ABIL62_09395 [Planctomycetota bacterium]